MITPKDIRNPTRASGYSHVTLRSNSPSKGRFVANVYNTAQRRDASGRVWQGPRRATALEAAQDYCDYMNGTGATPATRPTLRSAGHTGRRTRLVRTPEVQHALGVLRDARGQREGQQGYVYLIVEALLDSQGNDTGNVSLNRGKIGYSTNPDARVAELQEGNSRPLRLYAAKPGTEADEKALHAKYTHLNILQEWFRLTADVLLEWDVKYIRIGKKVAA